MAYELEKRLLQEGRNPDDVVRTAEWFGAAEAAREVHCGDIAMARFLKKKTGDENFGRNPRLLRLVPRAGKSFAEEFFLQLKDFIQNYATLLENQHEQDQQRITELENALQHYSQLDGRQFNKSAFSLLETISGIRKRDD